MARAQVAQVGTAELAGQAERVVAVHLEAAPVHPGRYVERGVVDRAAVDVRRVQAHELTVEERGEVGVVRQRPVDLHRERGAYRVRRGLAEHLHQLGVVPGRLEHDHRAGGAARLQVEHHPAVAGERVVGGEPGGPAQARLLRVGEHEDDVVAGTRAGGERPGHLQDRGGAGGVVVAARPGLHRVVVGDQEHLSGRVGAGQAGHHVADPGQRRPAGRATELTGLGRDRVLHLGLQAQPAQRPDQVLAYPVVGGAACYVRLGRDHLDVPVRPGGAELSGRRVRRARRRSGEADQDARPDGEQRDKRGDGAGQPAAGLGERPVGGAGGGCAHGDSSGVDQRGWASSCTPEGPGGTPRRCAAGATTVAA